MLENALLSYVNIKNHVFDNADLNFDNEYEFHLHIDKSTYPHYKYKLIVEKKDSVPIPDGFWGKNITSLNVIIGKNGAGKTSVFRFLANNLIPSTAMNGEGMLYIIRYNDIFLYFTNIRNDRLEVGNNIGIKILYGDEYIRTHADGWDFRQRYRNNHIWKSVIMYSNSFDLEYIAPNNEICIDASKNSRIKTAVKNITENSISYILLEKEILKQNNLKILEYNGTSYFDYYAKKLNIKLPHAIHFKIIDQVNQKYVSLLKNNYSEKFSNLRFIGHNRYSYNNENGYHTDSSEFEFEAALNKFVFILMDTLLSNHEITQEIFDKFVEHLSQTYNNDVIKYVYDLLFDCKIVAYADILKFLSDESKHYVLYWQSDKELVLKWDENDITLIKSILSQNYDFFECDLVRIDSDGYYSAGESSKLDLFLALCDARKAIDVSIKGVNNNIMLILDEYDVGFHPEYQIKIISEIIEMVGVIFDEYTVQLIIATNTPLEITDIPAQSIIYLKERKVISLPSTAQCFAGNVCSLLKDNFYISTTMGDFAKSKINAVLDLINGYGQNISHEEAKFIISIIGEPIIKKKLEEMYNSKFPENTTTTKLYNDKLSVLKKMIACDPNINEESESKALSLLESLDKIISKKEDD